MIVLATKKMNPLNRYHNQVTRWLTNAGISWMAEYPVGPWHLDIYLKEMNLGVEIDGPCHGLRRKKDQARDEEINETYGIPILRIKVGTPKEEAMGLMIPKEVEFWIPQ